MCGSVKEYKRNNLWRASDGSEEALFLSTSAQFLKLRCTFQEQHNVTHRSSILQHKKFGRIYGTDNNWPFDIDSGITNAKCNCSEWVTLFGSTAEEANNYRLEFFLFMLRTQLMIHHFCKGFALKQALLPNQSCPVISFRWTIFAKNFLKLFTVSKKRQYPSSLSLYGQKIGRKLYGYCQLNGTWLQLCCNDWKIFPKRASYLG